MRYTVSILIFSMIFQVSISQKLEKLDEININTKFKLKLIKINANEYAYQIISQVPFNDKLNPSSAHLLLDDSLKTNEIQGIFARGKFGNAESTLLVIKSGFDAPLDYNLYVDISGKGKYKQTSTIEIYPNIPSLEMWTNRIHSLKISAFKKVIDLPQSELVLDTTCYSEYDIKKGNILFNEQLTLILNLITQQEVSGIDKIKEFENSIKSVPESAWGWGNELNILDRNNRLVGTYINRRKISEPLVYKITECPYLERQVAYFFTKKKKNIKFVVFKWRQNWVGGWQSKAFSRIERDFRYKHKFIRNIMNQSLGAPNEILEEDINKVTTKWVTDEGVAAELYLYIDQYSKGLKLKIYIENE